MNQLNYSLYAYQQSLLADHYIVRLVDAAAKRKTQPRRYAYHSLPSVGNYLRHMNSQGYHVYCRPEGYEFVLIDDIPRNKLGQLLKFKPALATETSPNNFQAFLRLPCAPESREQAATICQETCQLLNGDLGSAEPDHLGRLPGFLNLKPKYRSKNGTYPTVLLHHAIDQFTSFSPDGRKAVGGVSTSPKIARTVSDDRDRSSDDFAFACLLWKEGKDSSEIEYETSCREKGRHRPDYVKRTVANAYRRVKAEGAVR